MSRLFFLLIVYICTCNIANGQFSQYYNEEQKRNSETKKIITVKSDLVLPVIVSQPDCPLQVEKAVVVENKDGGISILYEVRNKGIKTINSYTIAKWLSDNTGEVTTGEMTNSSLPTGQTAGNLTSSFSNKTESFNYERQSKADIKRIAFIMIVEILFSDGSRYNANDTFNALENHLRNFEFTYKKFDEANMKKN